MNAWKISGFITILMMLMLAACSVLRPSPTPLVKDTKVDVGERGLYLFCDGKGSPTVVFDSGYGSDSSYWATVYLETIKYTSACIYDRANLGRSDPALKPRTSQDMVADLHTLLTKAQIPGPYLLVGHSMAGFNMLEYANQYPQDVAGLVLVDPSHPDQGDHLHAILPTESPTEAESLKNCRPNPTSVAWDSGQNEPEGVHWTKSSEQVRAIKSLGDIPLTIITAGINGWPCSPATAELEHQDWLGLHQQYLKLSTNSKQLIAENANHIVMEGQPEIIVQAIRERVDEVRVPNKNKRQPEMTPNPTVAPNKLPVGYIDGEEGEVGLSNCKAWGWVIDRDNPEIDLTVRVLSDGKEVASQVANTYRDNLVQAGACPGGTCAFSINLYELISHDQEHSILVQAQDIQNGAWITLHWTPKIINCR